MPKMESECFQYLHGIIAKYPLLHQFLDDDFIINQCKSGIKCFLLVRLHKQETSKVTSEHLPSLENRLSGLSHIPGYDKLMHLIRGAKDWDDYQDFLTQIDATLWLSKKGLAKEIEPKLPEPSEGYTDVLLSFADKIIYCEAKSCQSLIKSIEFKKEDKKQKRSIVRTLREKTKKQCPGTYPCILALDTTKSAIFKHDIRDIAEQLLPKRPQIALIILWSWEGHGEPTWDYVPSAYFINATSKHRNLAENLLTYLGVTGEVIA